jgi:hypothetical protein
MSDSNGKPLSPRQTTMPGDWSSSASDAQMTLLALGPCVRVASVLMLLVLVLWLTACAATSAPPSTSPQNPTPPPSALPESPPNYSADAQRNISEWRKLLTERTAKPAN